MFLFNSCWLRLILFRDWGGGLDDPNISQTANGAPRWLRINAGTGHDHCEAFTTALDVLLKTSQATPLMIWAGCSALKKGFSNIKQKHLSIYQDLCRCAESVATPRTFRE